MFIDLHLLFRMREKGLELQLGESIELNSDLMQQPGEDHVYNLLFMGWVKTGDPLSWMSYSVDFIIHRHIFLHSTFPRCVFI